MAAPAQLHDHEIEDIEDVVTTLKAEAKELLRRPVHDFTQDDWNRLDDVHGQLRIFGERFTP